jgi:NDP-sugar pyrophosphorylase family protein
MATLKPAKPRNGREDRGNYLVSPTTAVILSGGAGVRLRPITDDLPKGLVRVGGKPLLEWVVEWLRHNNVTDLVIGVAYLREQIMKHFGDGAKFGVKIRYSHHSVEGGTGEGFRLAIKRHVDADSFYALNGDQITDINLKTMFRTHDRSQALATIALVHPRLPFGLVLRSKTGMCRGFEEKPILKNLSCSSGVYVFDKRVSEYLPNTGDVEKTTFPRLTRENHLMTYVHRGSFLTVNSIRELEEADRELRGSKNR